MKHGQFVPRAGEQVRLWEIDPNATPGLESEESARESEQRDTREMIRLQDMLMAHERHGLVILFQGMDASGKDEAIRDVLAHLDPRSCEFKQFKSMTEKEARHDYLWRVVAALPARGQIGIFNRSYYEHVTGERVHPERLEEQKLPEAALQEIWKKRVRQINHFEQYLVENGIHLLKFFLHISKEEQCERLLERVRDPESRWQFSQNDIEEREHWDEYMRVYSDVLTHTNTEHAPWRVIPGNHRWFGRAVIAREITAKLRSLHSEYPAASPEQDEAYARAIEVLEAERNPDAAKEGRVAA
ncbi:MAG: PPK2 family polyphosphate kinase [Actinomycetota bacterium]